MIDTFTNKSVSSASNFFVFRTSSISTFSIEKHELFKNSNSDQQFIDNDRFINNNSLTRQSTSTSTNSIFTFIDMIDNWQNTDFNQQQWTALQSLMRTFEFFESFDFQEFQKAKSFQNTSVVDSDNDNRWNVDEVDFFDFMYDDKSAAIDELIEHIDKNMYFRNVIYFIDRIKDMTEVKKVEVIRQNLYICFRSIALVWYIIIFIENQKRLVKLNNDVDEWARVLHKRFKKSTFFVMTTITKERYIMNNVKRKREFMKYAHIITRAAKIINMIVIAQIFLIFNDLNLKFRRDLIKITNNITIKIFLQNMKNNKKIRWNLKIRNRSSHIDYFINRSVNSFRFVEQQNSYNFNFSNNRFDNSESFSQSRNYDFEYDYSFFDNQSRLTQYSIIYQFNNQNKAYQNQLNQFDYRQQSSTTKIASQFEKSQSQLVFQQYRSTEFIQLITSIRSVENASDFQFKFVQQQQQYRFVVDVY